MDLTNKYISTTVFPDGSPIGECIQELLKNGYLNIELGSTHPYEENVEDSLNQFEAN